MTTSNINNNTMEGSKSNKDNKSSPYLTALWHGLGLFGESYLLFSVGTMRPLWETLYPSCFDESDDSACPRPYLSYQSITYSVVLGVMVGMIGLGVMANNVGRRRGSIITATLMAVGAICLTSSSIFLSSNPSTLFPVMSLSLFIFGIGVGGEYPLSASSASERAMAAMKKRQRHEFEHVSKMKRLLGSSPAASVATPRKGNLSTRDDGKQDSLLRINTTEKIATFPWQTLQSKSSNETEKSDGNKKLSIVTESYGDVPLSPTNITKETNNSLSSYNASLRTRGRDVLLVFSMQGLGILANSLMLTVLLMVTRKSSGSNQGGENYNNGDAGDEDANSYYYEPSTLLNIWRVTYATGAAILIYVLVSRIIHLTESEVWQQDRRQREEERRERHQREVGVGFKPPQVAPSDEKDNDPVVSPTMSSITMRSEFDHLGSTNLDGCKACRLVGVDEEDSEHGARNNNKKPPSEIRLLFRHYGVRLFGTSVTWLLWDIAYYGNKLFQSSFLLALTGEDASLVDITSASLINAFVALLGYYAAAALVDDPDCGRLVLQQTGLIITGALFILCGCLNDRLSSTWLVIMYFGSSFFGQCGPNCTTFLLAAEVFPTNMRTLCHGISACSGKVGALIAAILFNFLGEKDLFLLSGYANFAACLITFFTIPDVTTLDLYEIDKQWHKVLCDERYEGPATDPKHLSFYERNQNRLCCTR